MGDDVVELSGDLVTGALLGHPGLLFTFGEDRPVPLGFDDALLGVDEGGLSQSPRPTYSTRLSRTASTKPT